MAKNQKTTVNTVTALIAAILAYRTNSSQVVRFKNDLNQIDNKQLIADFFQNNQTIPEAEFEQLVCDANDIRTSLSQRVMLNTLTGSCSNEFLISVSKLLEAENIDSYKFGIIAWAPKLYDDTIKNDDAREKLLAFSSTSKFIGTVGKKISTNFELITCRYLKNYDSFAHHGHDGQGNLISFFNRKRIDSGQPITARVKAHRKDERISNSLVTVVNYVKEV